MRLSHLFLIPGLFAVGCGDNIQPANDESTTIESEPEVPGPVDHPDVDSEPETEDRPVMVGFYVSTVSCDAAIGELEAYAFYQDTQEPLTNFSCQYYIDGIDQAGTTVDGCLIQHDFGAGGSRAVNIRVTDLDTGKTYQDGGFAFVYPPYTTDLEVTAPECGLEFSYNATASAGGEFSINISPAENVLTPDYVLQRQLTVQVSQPGTYTIRYDAEDERTTGGICSREVVREVTVVDCHDHTPTCGH